MSSILTQEFWIKLWTQHFSSYLKTLSTDKITECLWLWSSYDNILTQDKTEILGENLFLCHFVHYKSTVDCPGIWLRPLHKRSVPNHLSPSIANSAYRCFLLITSSVFSILLKHTTAHSEVHQDMLRLFKGDSAVHIGVLHYYIIGTTTIWMDHTLNINVLNLAKSV